MHASKILLKVLSKGQEGKATIISAREVVVPEMQSESCAYRSKERNFMSVLWTMRKLLIWLTWVRCWIF